MQQLDDDIVYCCDPDCKQANKIISSAKQNCVDHNRHETKLISNLRAELLQVSNEENPLNIPTTHDKEDLMAYIDKDIDSLTKLFHQTLLDLKKKLKLFVDDNFLVSLKNIQLLFKAVLDNNRELINQCQSEFGYLKRDSKYFKEKDLLSKDIYQQLQKTFELTKNRILDLSQYNIKIFEDQKLINPDEVIHKWSSVNKHQFTKIDGKIVKNTLRGFKSVLIEPKLTFQETRVVQLKAISANYSFIQICDLKVVKEKCPTLKDIYQNGFGAYSQYQKGGIYATDIYGHGTQKSFLFNTGDILELQWNGPLKTFTTLKVSTGEKFEFQVSYSADAEIYFGVAMLGDDSFQIV